MTPAAEAEPGDLRWKLERDPFLREVCARWGDAAAEEAGFFIDADPDDAPLDDTSWLCTPTEIVRRSLAAMPGGPGAPDGAGPPVVLLSTGGFFPVHRGHLEMMARARDAAIAAGWRVVGGYLSPGHDDYIRLKCGSVPVGVSQRLARAEAAVAPTGWLSVDPWEALARRVSVNYTDVTARLQAYLRTHLDPAIEVAFVGGGDNARFALAFATRGRAVFVGRPGHHDEVARWRDDPRVRDDARILWVEGADPGASRSLRPVAWSRAEASAVHLRLEDGRAVATLGLAEARWRRFQSVVHRELDRRVPVVGVPVEAPAGAKAGTISLDPMVPGEVDLAISRLFDIGGYRQLGHVARPGADPLDVQCARIPAGSWSVWDDDRATGATFGAVEALLREDIVLVGGAFAIDPRAAGARGGAQAVEIADCRDFLLGSDHGGLVLALPDGSVGRAPYLLPYVDPAVRCGLPAGDARSFSLTVWEANAELFAPTGRRVLDLPAPAAATLRVAGYEPDALLVDVCRAHVRVLAALAPINPSPPADGPAGSRPARA